MKETQIESNYQVATGAVKVSVSIGNRQLGYAVVRLGSRRIAMGDEVKDATVGKGSTVKGKTIHIKTVVADVDDKTNETVVKYRLRGGKTQVDLLSKGVVDNDGEAMVHRAHFQLV